MTEDQARKLATRIIDTWPTGPKAYIWRDVLIHLDPIKAADVYRHFVETADKVTIGQFKSEYDRRTRSERPTTIRWTGHEIGFDEYIGRLRVKASNGESEAIEELANWNRWLTKESA